MHILYANPSNTLRRLCWAMAAIHGQPSNSFFFFFFFCEKSEKSQIKANENAKPKQKQSKMQKQSKTTANNKAKTKRNNRQKNRKNVAVRICCFFPLFVAFFSHVFALLSHLFRFFSHYFPRRVQQNKSEKQLYPPRKKVKKRS